VTSKSDIVEDLCSADPEANPSAAKIIMARAAAEIERLRGALREIALMTTQQDDGTGRWLTVERYARAALKEQ
jgi:hypothetical protein